MRKDKEVKDLTPDWFKPESYAINKDFDLFDYYHNLIIRILFTRFTPSGKKYSKEVKKPHYQKHLLELDFLNQYKDLLKSAPISKASDKDRESFYKSHAMPLGDEHLHKSVQNMSLFTDSIKPMSWDFIKHIDTIMNTIKDDHYSNDEKELLELEIRAESLNQDDIEKIECDNKIQAHLKRGTASILNDPLCTHFKAGITFLEIDLKSPDKVLENDFKKFLKAVRKLSILENISDKEITPLKLLSWKQFKVLEYIDLTLWFAIHGKPVSDNNMKIILFPEGKGGHDASVDTIRGSTRVYVDELLSISYFLKMKQQLWIFKDEYLKVV